MSVTLSGVGGGGALWSQSCPGCVFGLPSPAPPASLMPAPPTPIFTPSPSPLASSPFTVGPGPEAPPTTRCLSPPPSLTHFPAQRPSPFTSLLCQDLDSRGQRSGAWSLQAPHPWTEPNQPFSRAGRGRAGQGPVARLRSGCSVVSLLNRCAEEGVWEARGRRSG